jgi:hypothetical protein
LADDAARKFYGIETKASSKAAAQTDDTIALLKTMAKQAKLSKADIEKTFLPALDEGGDLGMAAFQLQAAGRPEAASLLHKLNEIRQTDTGRQIAAHVLDPERIHNTEAYVSRTLTPKGRKLLGTDQAAETLIKTNSLTRDAFPTGIQTDLAQGGHVLARSILPDKSIQDIEAILGPKLGAKAGEDLFEHNVLQTMAIRHNAANHAIAQSEALDALSKVKGADGNPLAVVIPKGMKPPEHLAHYEPVEGLTTHEAFVHPAVKRELSKARAVLTNDKALQGYSRQLSKITTMWKGYATVVSPGFHMRNALGNVFNNYLAGGIGVRDYARATHIQKIAQDARQSGEEVEKYLATHLSKQDFRAFQQARQHGVIEAGFFAADLGAGHTSAPLNRVLQGRSLGEKAASGLNPASVENAFVRNGRSVGAAVENNARLAHYLGKTRHGLDAKSAAESVQKYLFDYGDLTAFERERIKPVVAFYTYMRKNTPLQMSALLKQPGKFSALAHSYFDVAATQQGGNLPDYAIKQGQIPVMGGRFTIGPDLPFSAATEIVEPLTSGTASERARGALRPLSGPLPGLAKALAETATGTSLLTGGKQTLSAKKNILQSVMPGFAKLQNSPVGKRDAESLIRTLSGLNAAAVTDKRKNSENRRRIDELQDDPRQAQESGHGGAGHPGPGEGGPDPEAAEEELQALGWRVLRLRTQRAGRRRPRRRPSGS